ncbi:MAG TPA: DUF5675 family protein [Longimicrobiales bacterium]|nr:DUF5675 family protein [Longimicrobiales bacterium]
MIRYELQRLEETEHGTIGRMGEWWTLEEEDRDNAVGEGRIPAGTYTCRRSFYYKGGYVAFEVKDVPGRSRILIHRGNTEEDTAGCILLGMRLGHLTVEDEESGERMEKPAVLQSAEAFRQFMATLRSVDEFELEITDIPHPERHLADSGISEARRRQIL